MAAPITGALLDLFADTITVQAGTADGFGTVTGGATRTLRARVVGQNRQVAAGGLIRTSTVQAYLPGVYDVGLLDIVTLPIRFEPRVMPIMAIQRTPDENGAHHEILMF